MKRNYECQELWVALQSTEKKWPAVQSRSYRGGPLLLSRESQQGFRVGADRGPKQGDVPRQQLRATPGVERHSDFVCKDSM